MLQTVCKRMRLNQRVGYRKERGRGGKREGTLVLNQRVGYRKERGWGGKREGTLVLPGFPFSVSEGWAALWSLSLSSKRFLRIFFS